MGYRAKGSVVSICPGRAKEGLSLSVVGTPRCPIGCTCLYLSWLRGPPRARASYGRSERALHVEQKDIARYLQGSAVRAPGTRGVDHNSSDSHRDYPAVDAVGRRIASSEAH